MITFSIKDRKTGHYPDVGRIALTELWARGLIHCDIDEFAITESGALVLIDECGNCAYAPDGRFEVTLCEED